MDKILARPCLNCKHLKKYYAKENNGFRFLGKGCCKARNLSIKQQRRIPFMEDCEMWEEENLQEQQQKSISLVIEDIKFQLDKLLEVVFDEIQ